MENSANIAEIADVDWDRYELLLYKFLQQEMRRGSETSIQIKGIDFRLSNLSNNMNNLRKKAQNLFSR